MTIALVRKENLIEKLVLTKSFWFVLIAFFFSYPIYKSLNRTLPPELPVYGVVKTFSLLNEEGKSFGSVDLKGKAYIANFVTFDSNENSKAILKEIEIIQHRLRGVLDRVGVISFSLNTTETTPAVLFAKARELKAKPFVWRFLTGDQSVVENLVLNEFKVPVDSTSKNASTMNELLAEKKLVLVDGDARIRGYYKIDKDSINKLMIDIGLLINRNSNK